MIEPRKAQSQSFVLVLDAGLWLGGSVKLLMSSDIEEEEGEEEEVII